jgi:hypothetical protein
MGKSSGPWQLWRGLPRLARLTALCASDFSVRDLVLG